jgi:ribosome-binding protein aMBF1 (putative translation factor)
MQIHKPEDMLAAIESARQTAGLSERQLSAAANKSPSAYWWWKKKVGVTSFNTAVEYARAVGLAICVVPEEKAPE